MEKFEYSDNLVGYRGDYAADWLVTIKHLAEIFADAGVTESSIRADYFKSKDRINSRGETIKGNGLAEHEAFVKRGRKVLARPQRYGNWMAGRAPKSR